MVEEAKRLRKAAVTPFLNIKIVQGGHEQEISVPGNSCKSFTPINVRNKGVIVYFFEMQVSFSGGFREERRSLIFSPIRFCFLTPAPISSSYIREISRFGQNEP